MTYDKNQFANLKPNNGIKSIKLRSNVRQLTEPSLTGEEGGKTGLADAFLCPNPRQTETATFLMNEYQDKKDPTKKIFF